MQRGACLRRRLGLVALVLCGALVSPAVANDQERRMRLEAIGFAMALHMRDHGGKLPARLADLYDGGYVLDLGLFTMPDRDAIGAAADIDAKTDYQIATTIAPHRPTRMVWEKRAGEAGGALAFYSDGSVRPADARVDAVRREETGGATAPREPARRARREDQGRDDRAPARVVVRDDSVVVLPGGGADAGGAPAEGRMSEPGAEEARRGAPEPGPAVPPPESGPESGPEQPAGAARPRVAVRGDPRVPDPPAPGSRPADSAQSMRAAIGKLVWARNLDEALRLSRDGWRRFPGHLQIGIGLVSLELTRGNRREALEVSEELLRRYPADASALALRGTVAHHHGDRQTAAQMFERAVRIAPQLPKLHYEQAMRFYQNGVLELAPQLYLNAMMMDYRQYYIGHYYMGLIYASMQHPDRAIQEFELYLRTDNGSRWAAVARQHIEQLRSRRR